MHFFKIFNAIIVFGVITLFASCTIHEDLGPIQYNEQQYIITDFDRLDVGDAMFVTVTRGSLFVVEAKGDRRNLDDLEMIKVGNTLTARFRNNRNRKHTTYINVTIPSLVSANFYGATSSTLSGFEETDFLLNLSGASFSQADINADIVQVILSGASNLTLSGSTQEMTVDLSGASLFKAYNMNADNMTIGASGASHAYVKANKTIVADASGASSILYRGDATISANTSGASSVIKD